ncbi:hypothetical protein Plim_0202 [Planctopirus limnophila DSM 3776]|uniref:Uncharacterized protein n=1 Tax=Planctopirus limnophila (strain ATCC 43296 / DSM 3776 / IFAM 1008 / Mu 290) TaxID=521674 RepID=D5SNC7_PLAL2|nr:hypothetical protein Plim_0202 [Planctopirus limnophila DSM 3776]
METVRKGVACPANTHKNQRRRIDVDAKTFWQDIPPRFS